jgi:hypothetical protein
MYMMKSLFKRLFCLAAASLMLGACSLPDSETPVKDMARKVLRGRVPPSKVDTGLPILTIATDNALPVTSKETYVPATLSISAPGAETDGLAGTIEIRGRGNTTWNHPKKPYRIRFAEKTALFGLEKAKNWVLLANYQDPRCL